jgi:hypothetical protein
MPLLENENNDTAASDHGARALLWVGPALTFIGLAMHHLWVGIALRVEAIALSIAIGVGLLSWLLHKTLRWRLSSGIAAIWLVLLALFAGPLPVLATALVALAAIGLGTLMLPKSQIAPGARLAFALLAGLALISGSLGWLLPLPIHRQWVYFVALATIVIWRRTEIRALFGPLPDAWSEAVAASPWLSAFGLLVVGLASTACWLPTMQFDDLTYHLALPFQLQELGYYRLDFVSSVWALAPWSSDVLHGLVQVTAANEARGALDAMWLMLSTALLWQIGAGLELAAWSRWLLIALYASHPLVSILASGMQTEGPAIAVTFALALLVLRAPDEPDAPTLRLAAVLSGLLIGLKVLHAVAIPPLLVWLLIRWRGRLPWHALPGAIALTLLIGGSSYAYAWGLTSNPILPLYNAWFRSPALDAINVIDPRWKAGWDWDLPWRITFATSRYGEILPGGAGFALVALFGALLLSLRDQKTRAIALVGLVVAVLPFLQLQYLRYAQPGLMLLLPAMVGAVVATIQRRAAIAFLVSLACLNLAFQTNAMWMLHDGALETRVMSGATATIAQFAPERRISAYLRAQPESGAVLFTGNPFAAESAGHGYFTIWHDQKLSAIARTADQDPSGDAWRAAFASIGLRWVVTTPSQVSPSLKAALVGAQRAMVVGDAALWRLPPTWSGSRDLFVERDYARKLPFR